MNILQSQVSDVVLQFHLFIDIHRQGKRNGGSGRIDTHLKILIPFAMFWNSIDAELVVFNGDFDGVFRHIGSGYGAGICVSCLYNYICSVGNQLHAGEWFGHFKVAVFEV